MKKAFLVLGAILCVISLMVACGGEEATPTPTPPPPTDTPGPPTATAPPTSTSPPPPTATPEESEFAEQKFKFVAPLGTQEESERIENVLTGLSGIEEATVNEISVTVEYDPAAITLEEVQETIESLGYEVERQ